MCVIVYEMIDKYPFQTSRPPLPSRSAGRNPSLLAFGLFTLSHLLQLFNFFHSSQRQLLAKCRYLSAFGLYELFMNFLGSYKLIKAHMSQKSLLQGYQCTSCTCWSTPCGRICGACFSAHQLRSGTWQTPIILKRGAN